MLKKLTVLCLVCGFGALAPALAVQPYLQVPSFDLSGQTVTVSVHNSTAGPMTTRVQVTIRLDDGTLATLTSAEFTVAGGATTSVSLSAPQNVAGIEDNPEPIGTVQ